MIQILNALMVLILGFTYLFMTYGLIWKGHSYNAVTWILWTILDLIALYGTIRNHDDSTLLLTYVSGTSLVALTTLLKGHFELTWVEGLTCFLTMGCIAYSKFGTPSMTVWASGFALTVSGLPHLRKEYKKQFVEKSSKQVAVLFLAAMACATLAAMTQHSPLIIPLFGLGYWAIGTLISFTSHIRRRRPLESI